VVVQGGGIAPERDGMEVQREDLPLGEQERCQGGDPAGEELLLVDPLGAVGVVGGEGGLGLGWCPGDENVEYNSG
jgi:hypothetical protein